MIPTRPGSPSPVPRAPIPGEVVRAGYFDAAHRATRSALSRGEQRCTLRVAGQGITLRFPTSSIADAFLPALAHLVVPEDGPDDAPCICAWDSRSTGISMPAGPWRPGDYLSRGDLRGWDTDVRAAYNLGPGTLSLFDPARNTGIFWMRDFASLPSWDRAAPFRTILGWFLRTRRIELLHAGAVGHPSGGVLLAGRGGRGKSTVCLSAMALGDLRYAGDDYVAIASDPGPQVWSVYNSGKLEWSHAQARLPELAALADRVSGDQQDKGTLFVHRHFPERVATGFPIRAVLLPEVGMAQQSALEPIPPLAVVQEMLSTTMSQLPGTDAGTFRTLTTLVRAVPCYRLAVGADLGASVAAIRELLARIP